MPTPEKPLKVACITCYSDPDYVRARTLRASLATMPQVELIVCKNQHKGLARYGEMAWKLLKLRLTAKPDVYVLTFRGQEILAFVLLLAGKCPVIFDEFLVPLAWAHQEHHAAGAAVTVQKTLAKLFALPYKRWLAACHTILADTEPHALLSSQLSGVPRERYLPVPVGADETMFKPAQQVKKTQDAPFQVFFCGNMRPLYGLSHVLSAAEELKDRNIEFHIAGGDQRAATDVASAIARGAKIKYQRWLPFNDFPAAMRTADLCLTQYGNTPQARRVISGKAYQMLACARPIVLGASEASTMFVDKQNCLLVPQADAAAIAAAIMWAQNHPKELAVIARQGRVLYERLFSNRAITTLLAPLIDSVRHPV